MNMYKDANELMDNEMPRSIRIQLFPFFLSGIEAYRQIVEGNSGFFNSVFAANIRGPLLNYLIFRQFETDMTTKNFPFKTESRNVNNFYYKSLSLLKGDVIVNVGKAYSTDGLPNRAIYRKKYCRLNLFREKNQLFDISEHNDLVIRKEPYCMFLTYGIRNGAIDFVNLIVPNTKMTGYLAKKDLKAECLYVAPKQVYSEDVEKRVSALKEDVQKQLDSFKNINDEGEES